VARLWRRTPSREPYSEPQETGIAELIERVVRTPLIAVHLSSTVTETAGAPGRFKVHIAHESGATVEETVGSIVQASGFSTYELAKLPELGGGTNPHVIDQAGLEALARAAQGGPIRRADGTPCAAWCSSSAPASATPRPRTCRTARPLLRHQHQAGDVLQNADPDVDTMVLYSDLRVPGMGEDFYRSAQHKGVTFTKGQASGVEALAGGARVRFRDLILDQDAAVDADLVVLATGQVANAGVDLDTWTQTVTAGRKRSESARQRRSELQKISVLNMTTGRGRTCRS